MVLDIPGGLFEQSDVREMPQTTIISGTRYWSCPGTAFIGTSPEKTGLERDHITGKIESTSLNRIFVHVNIPHGAIIIAVIVYASKSVGAFWLKKIDHAGNKVDMAVANFNSEDTSITDATIDNDNYSYMINTGEITANTAVYGARITYTL